MQSETSDTLSLSHDARFLDNTLRPVTWEDYTGQKQLKKSVGILLRAAKLRSAPPEHLLFYGPPGLGKTTLAHIIARDLGVQMKITSGPAIERVGDLASILTNLTPGDVLFIDEVHRLNRSIEEVLYPAMESGVIDIILGKGPSARTIQLELPPFTLVAATTRIALLSSPLRSRFSGGIFKLEYYKNEELANIIARSASLLGVALDKEAVYEISRRSRGTPRTANFLLKRSRDYAQVQANRQNVNGQNTLHINTKVIQDAMELLGIDELGLSATDRDIIEIIIKKFKGGPVGLTTLAAAASEEIETIEEVHEPYLLQLGFIERTPRGRVVTEIAHKHLKN